MVMILPVLSDRTDEQLGVTLQEVTSYLNKVLKEFYVRDILVGVGTYTTKSPFSRLYSPLYQVCVSVQKTEK